MRAFAALLRLDLRSAFGWKPFSEYKTPKDWLKLAGMGLIALLLIADIAVVFAASAIAQYQALKPQGLQDLLILNGALSASVGIFVLGFVTILSGWSLSAAEAQLFALPLGDRAQLAARAVVVYVTQIAIALLLFGANLAVYGISERPPFAWWLTGLIAAFALPVVPLALSWLIVTPLMSAARFMRSKNAVLVISGVVGVAFAVAFNIYIQTTMSRLSDPAWVVANYAGPSTALNLAGSTWPPSRIVWKALEAAASGQWVVGLGMALGLAVAGLALHAIVVFAVGRAWRRSVLAFGESSLRRLEGGSAAAFIARHFRRHGTFRALFLREWRLMNREPLYFLNGPLIVALLPLILVAMYVAQRGRLQALAGLAATPDGLRIGFLAAAAFGAFLGSSTSIAATALSRDAKALPATLALPVGAFEYMAAKLAHALVWALAGALIGSLSAGLALGMPIGTVGAAAFVALAFSCLVNLAGLWIDTARPRLAWDNPMAALKQNPNSVFVILGTMGAIAGIGWLSMSSGLAILWLAATIGGASILLFAIGLVFYARFARAKLGAIEPA